MSIKKLSDPAALETSQRIKHAARTLFLEKGPENTRTWEIAERSETNTALISYYFRSKEKLCQVVMLEELAGFLQTIVPIVNDGSTPFERKIELLVERYVVMADSGPHLPLFILNEMLKGHSGLKNQIKKMRNMLHRSVMAGQLRELVKSGKYRNITFSEVIINIIGLNVFPVIALPAMQIMGGLSDEDYTRMIKDRQRRITDWVFYMMK